MISIHGDLRYIHRVPRLIAGGILTALLATALGPARGHAQGASGPIPTAPNLKVAFIGDSGDGENLRQVLGLIKSEGAVMVMDESDLGYMNAPYGMSATTHSSVL